MKNVQRSIVAILVYTDLIYAFGTTLLPLLLMIIFGLLTIKKVCYAQRRVQAMIGPVFNHEKRNTTATTNKKKGSKFN